MVGFAVHESNYKIQQVKCVESPYGIVDNPWDLRDSGGSQSSEIQNPLERDQCRVTAHLPQPFQPENLIPGILKTGSFMQLKNTDSIPNILAR